MGSQHKSYDVVVCGAGIAGIACANALAEAGVERIAIVDHGPPLGLTSDKSTECYRNWWPGPGEAMVALMNRSIDLMEEHARQSDNRFLLERQGYVFATARPDMVDVMRAQALEAESLGAGPLRTISRAQDYQPADSQGFGRLGFDSSLEGADLLTDPALIREHFPYLSSETIAVLHARRCGALSAQQLGMYLLERARANGVELIPAKLVGIERSAGCVNGVLLQSDQAEQRLSTDAVVMATGPHLRSTLDMLGISLPVSVETHIKISVADRLGVIPRSAPLIIWTDPIELPWSQDERDALAQSEDTNYLLREFPAGAHGRPTGAGNQVLMYWTYACESREEPEFPLTWDPNLPEITFRGMAVMVPGLRAYFDAMPRPFVDGGYYTKTPENRPLIGPLEVPGAYVCSAFSGFGIMAAMGSGELLAQHVVGKELPGYAAAFRPDRYADPAYQTLLETWDASGQL